MRVRRIASAQRRSGRTLALMRLLVIGRGYTSGYRRPCCQAVGARGFRSRTFWRAPAASLVVRAVTAAAVGKPSRASRQTGCDVIAFLPAAAVRAACASLFVSRIPSRTGECCRRALDSRGGTWVACAVSASDSTCVAVCP